MKTALQIRRELEALLVGRIGTYKLTDGSSTPAVWIGGKVSNKVSSVSGIEILINPTPDMPVEALMASEKVVRAEHFVRIIQHSANTSMVEVLQLIAARFELSGSPIVQQETDDMAQQATVRIRDDYVLRKQP